MFGTNGASSYLVAGGDGTPGILAELWLCNRTVDAMSAYRKLNSSGSILLRQQLRRALAAARAGHATAADGIRPPRRRRADARDRISPGGNGHRPVRRVAAAGDGDACSLRACG